MQRRRGALNRVIIFSSLVFLSGCGAPLSEGVYFNQSMDFASLQKVAVLPFQNLTDVDAAAERVRDAFMGMLLATEAVYVLPSGELARAINRIGMQDPSNPSTEEIQKLNNILQVDAFITGTLREYGTVRSGVSSANVVSLSLQMIETEAGTIIWSAASTKGGITAMDRLFGAGGEPMNTVTEEVINDLLDKLFL